MKNIATREVTGVWYLFIQKINAGQKRPAFFIMRSIRSQIPFKPRLGKVDGTVQALFLSGLDYSSSLADVRVGVHKTNVYLVGQFEFADLLFRLDCHVHYVLVVRVTVVKCISAAYKRLASENESVVLRHHTSPSISIAYCPRRRVQLITRQETT